MAVCYKTFIVVLWLSLTAVGNASKIDDRSTLSRLLIELEQLLNEKKVQKEDAENDWSGSGDYDGSAWYEYMQYEYSGNYSGSGSEFGSGSESWPVSGSGSGSQPWPMSGSGSGSQPWSVSGSGSVEGSGSEVFGSGAGVAGQGWTDPAFGQLETCATRNIRDTGYKGEGSTTPNNQKTCGRATSRAKLSLRDLVGMRTLNKGRLGKIVGGQEASIAEYPWLVAVGRAGAGQECGGSLIAPDWVLTAAHCFGERTEPCQYIVRVGEHDLKSGAEKHVDIPAAEIIMHPDYKDEKTYPHDIALVKLSRPAPVVKDHINTICLPTADQDVPSGAKCVVAGWGDKTDGDGDYSNTIHWVQVPVLNTLTGCSKYLQKYGRKWLSAKTHVCAGYVKEGGKDSCQGDSGGPLFCQMTEGGPYVQAGVVSSGEGCAMKGWPGLYTNVKSYMPWINDVIRRN